MCTRWRLRKAQIADPVAASGGWRPYLAISAFVAVACVLTGRAYTQQAKAPSPRPVSGLAINYVDPALCAQCHAEEADNFRKTGMGRSFYRMPPGEPSVDFTVNLTTGQPFYHAASESYFAMIARGGKY